jgi:autophagy-related protein 18
MASTMVVNSVSFNHDSSCAALATNRGFRIVKTDTGEMVHAFDDVGPIRTCELLFDTRLVVCVGNGGGMETPDLSPRRLKILNVDWRTLIADLAFRTTVRSVKMNRHVLVVCDDEEVTVFEMKGLTRVMNVPQRKASSGENNNNNNNNNNAGGGGVIAINSDAVCASDFITSTSGEEGEDGEEEIQQKEDGRKTKKNNNNSYLALVSHLSETTVVIYDLHNVHVATEIPNAHEGPVAMLAFSQKGDILASCSVKGTVVRTWDVPSGEPRNIFRRGSTAAKITSLRFAYSSEIYAFEPELLAVSSDSGTAHVFQCFESTGSKTHNSSREGKEEEENEIDEEKKVEQIEAKYAGDSASTAQKILRVGGLVSKLALTGAKKVTKTSVNALSKVSNTVLHTTGVSTKFTKSLLEPKRAAAIVKLPAHKRMAVVRNEKFAIGLGSGESNVQVDVVNNPNISTTKITPAAAASASPLRVEWNVVSIRPAADYNRDATKFVAGSKSASEKKDAAAAALNMPPSLNPEDDDDNNRDAIEDDVHKDLTKRVRVVCASSTGILYDYRVRLKTQSSSSSSSSQAIHSNKDDDDNDSPLLETMSSDGGGGSSTTNNKSVYALEREISMLVPIVGAGGSSERTVRFTGFSGWRRPGSSSATTNAEKEHSSKKQSPLDTAEEEENALKYSMMQASQLRATGSPSSS